MTEITSDHLAYVIYTSGTTGVPKGNDRAQSVVNVVTQIRDAYGFSENEKITAYTSYVFDVSVSEFLVLYCMETNCMYWMKRSKRCRFNKQISA